MREEHFAFRFASLEEGMETFLTRAGPFVWTMEIAESASRGDEARRTFRATLAESNAAADGSLVLPAPYLLATGVRSRAVQFSSQAVSP